MVKSSRELKREFNELQKQFNKLVREEPVLERKLKAAKTSKEKAIIRDKLKTLDSKVDAIGKRKWKKENELKDAKARERRR